jgi:methylenetetrahydrofolate dehydrogenase (NADP+)/methenyltetrahydrofolate cyclohydrolase
VSAKLIDGKEVARIMRGEMKDEVKNLLVDRGIIPGLAVVIVGEDPASQVYVRNKEKGCAEVGIYSEKHALAADSKEDELLSLIIKLNKNPKIHGILVQLPLPEQIDEKKVISAIDPDKDVDGFHPINVGRLMIGEALFPPCTPSGIMELLKRSNVELKGKRAVVVGRSNIVGKPIALMLLAEHATVTICHSRTRDLAQEIRGGDVVIAAVGKPQMVKGDMIKEGAVVIDVGVNRLNDKLVGDVDFEAAKERASLITPVPGGVGPMTITMLLKNTIKAAQLSAK